MPSLTKDELLDMRISSIISSAEDAMFQKFDDLHKQGHTDDDVIAYLRKQGYMDYAEQYIEWSGAIDPDVDPTSQGEDLVTDPGDSETSNLIAESHTIGLITAVIVAELREQREADLYLDYESTPSEVLVDGNLDVTAVARRIVRELKVAL